MTDVIVLVVPCFNEGHRLDGEAFKGFLDAFPAFKLLFVNDGSTDATGDILDAMAIARPGRITCLHLARNAGKAEAVRQGFLSALATDTGFIGYLDADLSVPLSAFGELKKVLDAGPFDMVMGSRVKLLGRHIERSGTRHYFGRIFATAVSLVLDLPVYDTQCGAKLFRRNDTTVKIFSFPFMTRWIFDVEILARLQICRRIRNESSMADICAEYPLMAWVERSGSKIRFIDFVVSAFDLLRVFYLLRCCGVRHDHWRRLA